MPAQFQLVFDCKDPELLARFWAVALGYVLEPPPEGFATWDDWRRDIGFPESELGMGDGYRGRSHRSPRRGGARSLRGGDEGPRGQRVRHQLIPTRPWEAAVADG
jgi:hypothetical protein